MAGIATVQGLDELVHLVDQAVSRPDFESIAAYLKDNLETLIRQGGVRIPADLCTPCSDHYGRYLLYRSPLYGYAVVAMVWGPGQGTAVHDHAGTWCVEGVVQGSIEVTQYDHQEKQGELWHFERQASLKAGVGSAGSLIPPFEYHTIRNASAEEASITVHIYGEEMDRCTVFHPTEQEGWYRPEARQLSYDN